MSNVNRYLTQNQDGGSSGDIINQLNGTSVPTLIAYGKSDDLVIGQGAAVNIFNGNDPCTGASAVFCISDYLSWDGNDLVIGNSGDGKRYIISSNWKLTSAANTPGRRIYGNLGSSSGPTAERVQLLYFQQNIDIGDTEHKPLSYAFVANAGDVITFTAEESAGATEGHSVSATFTIYVVL